MVPTPRKGCQSAFTPSALRHQPQEITMTYEEFKKAYTQAFNSMMNYTCEQVGSSHFAEKMAELSDAYPEFEARLENEA